MSAAERATWRWMHRPVVDLALAAAWVPFVVLGLLVRQDVRGFELVAAGALLISIAHQPLTLGLVYGDPRQFAVRPRTFTIAPVVLAGVVWLALHASVVLVGVVGGLWNAHHTLMQRYGLTRVYGRKAGDDHGRLELGMLYSWQVLALVAAAADARTPHLIGRLALGGADAAGLEALVALQPFARAVVPVVALAAAATTWRWIGAERALGARRNPAKHTYVAGTAALFAVVLVDPAVGFVGYVGAHAVEYFITVHQALGSRYVEPRDPSPIGRLVRAAPGRIGGVAALLVAVAGGLWAIATVAGPVAYSTAFVTIGGLHILYDGHIWKLRRPEVAASFAID